MTWTSPFSDGIADLLACDRGQGEGEHRSAAGIGADRDAAAMRLDDGARDRQADAHALPLGGDERLEQLAA